MATNHEVVGSNPTGLEFFKPSVIPPVVFAFNQLLRQTRIDLVVGILKPMKISGLLTIIPSVPSAVFVPYPSEPSYQPGAQSGWIPKGDNQISQIRDFLINEGILDKPKGWPSKTVYYYDVQLDESLLAKWKNQHAS